MSIADIINATYCLVELEPEKHDSINWNFFTQLETRKIYTEFNKYEELPTVVSNVIIGEILNA